MRLWGDGRWNERWPLAPKLWVSRLVYLHEKRYHPEIHVTLTAISHGPMPAPRLPKDVQP